MARDRLMIDRWMVMMIDLAFDGFDGLRGFRTRAPLVQGGIRGAGLSMWVRWATVLCLVLW